MDLNSFFSQIHLARKSRVGFLGTGCQEVMQFKRAVQGQSSSLGGCSTIATTVFKDVSDIVYVDNLCDSKDDLNKLLANFKEIHRRASVLNLCFKVTDNAILFTTGDGEFQLLGYSIHEGRLRIPKKKKEILAEMPRTRKHVVRLISALQYYSLFSSVFSELMARIREELKTNTTKFVMTKTLERHLYALIHLVKHNNGLALLTPKQWEELKLVLFTDASSRSIGSVLCAVFPNHIIYPIYAQSKMLPRFMRSQTLCSNLTEMFGLHQALLACHNLIQGRMCCVFSDSIYVVRAVMSLELTALPARIRSMVLDIRVNYHLARGPSRIVLFRFPFPILPFSPFLPFSILPTPPPVLSRPCFTL